MSVLPNFIVDVNPFRLSGPPSWWLKRLWDFDDSLVVIPSKMGFYYRLAQRRKPNLGTNVVNDALFKESDTKMLASYGLVPVTTILATANWSNPLMFEDLRTRNVHRMGGAAKVNAMLDAQDERVEEAKRTKTDAHLTHLGKDAWRYYNKKIGVRSQMWSPTVPTRSNPVEPNSPAIIIKKG